MEQTCWGIWPDRGFLINPDPIVKLSEVPGIGALIPSEALAGIEPIAADMPELLETRRLHPTLDTLPVYDYTALGDATHLDFRVVECLMRTYCYFASAYVYATHEEAAHHIPKGVAVPLVQLAHMVERPPIISYCAYVLNNWERVDPASPVTLENIKLIQNFRGGRDEDWFILVHVAIEWQAAGALQGIQEALQAVEQEDALALESALRRIADSVAGMVKTFHRMPENCDPDVYYWRVRPYIFGFTDMLYEGVEEYGGQSQTFRGQTGAQSSIVPALVSALGLEHEQSGLTEHLNVMRDYMPKPHREFLARIRSSQIRERVLSGNGSLHEVYNECLRQLIAFRRLHLNFATAYIFNKVENPVGTGGTMYMDWLSQLIDETEAQLV